MPRPVPPTATVCATTAVSLSGAGRAGTSLGATIGAGEGAAIGGATSATAGGGFMTGGFFAATGGGCSIFTGSGGAGGGRKLTSTFFGAEEPPLGRWLSKTPALIKSAIVNAAAADATAKRRRASTSGLSSQASNIAL